MPQEFLIQNKPRLLYSIGELADAVGKSHYTVREWEREGRIPTAYCRSPRGYRLYFKEEIETLAEIVESENQKMGTHFKEGKFQVRVFEAWKKIRDKIGEQNGDTAAPVTG